MEQQWNSPFNFVWRLDGNSEIEKRKMEKEWKTNEWGKEVLWSWNVAIWSTFCSSWLSLSALSLAFIPIYYAFTFRWPRSKTKFQKPVSTHSIQMLIPITSSFTEQLENSFERIPNAQREKKQKERKEKWREAIETSRRTNERNAGIEEENCLKLVEEEKNSDVDLNWAKDTISTS